MAVERLHLMFPEQMCIRHCVPVNFYSCIPLFIEFAHLSASTSFSSSTYPAATSSFFNRPMLASNVCAASSLVSDSVATSNLRSMLACSCWKSWAFLRIAVSWLLDSVCDSSCSRRASSSCVILSSCPVGSNLYTRGRITCLLSRSCCSLTFSINESSASKSEDVASRSSM